MEANYTQAKYTRGARAFYNQSAGLLRQMRAYYTFHEERSYSIGSGVTVSRTVASNDTDTVVYTLVARKTGEAVAYYQKTRHDVA